MQILDMIAPLIAIAVLVAARAGFEAIKRLFTPPNILDQLHGRASVRLLVGEREIAAGACVLKSAEILPSMNGEIVTCYTFQAMQREP